MRLRPAPIRMLLEGAARPVGCWLAAAAVLLVTAAAAGYDPLSAGTWSRWDSDLYLSIAANGYEIEACRNIGWCGNAGWFPAYPWLVAVLAAPGWSLEATAVVLSWVFSLASLVVLRRTFLRELPLGAAAGGLVFAAFVPGMVYNHAAFPLAMLGFFSLLALWWLAQERWTRAGLATAVAGASYYLGVILIPIAAVFAASGRGLMLRERARRAALAGGLGALGPVVTELVIWAQTGAWDAFFLVQEPYEHKIRWPTVGLSAALSPLHRDSPLALDSASALQTLFVSLVVLA